MSQKSPYIPATSATDEPVYEIDSFELLWEQHKGKIIGGALVAIALIASVFGWLIISAAHTTAAEKAFSNAKTPADYQAVIEKYPSSPVSGDAALLLAKSLRAEKKYDDANVVLDRFVKAQPEHPFAPLAKVAAAENLALAGKTEEAEKALEVVAQTDGKSFAAPFALVLSAELKSAQGQRDEALRTYRLLNKSFPESLSARATEPALQSLESMAPSAAAVETPAAQAPAPAAK